MPYSPSNPPRLISGSVGAGGSNGYNRWAYITTDAFTDVRVAGYFTDGFDLGIRPNDVLECVKSDTKAAQIMVCNAGTSNATLDFTDGLAVAATDTD